MQDVVDGVVVEEEVKDRHNPIAFLRWLHHSICSLRCVYVHQNYDIPQILLYFFDPRFATGVFSIMRIDTKTCNPISQFKTLFCFMLLIPDSYSP